MPTRDEAEYPAGFLNSGTTKPKIHLSENHPGVVFIGTQPLVLPSCRPRTDMLITRALA